jgi:predicted dehydrogenase
MSNAMNWALVGTGAICSRFIVGLRAAGARAAAVVSRSLETARDFAGRYNIEKAFGNFDEMLGDPTIDVVYIGTPHTAHKDFAVRALKAKKAVLCEKPSAINLRELKEMINATRENQVFFMEAMWNGFSPPLCKVREWLAQGLLG